MPEETRLTIAEERSRRLRSWIFVLANLLSFVFLWLTLRGVDLVGTWHQATHMDWRWLTFGAVFNVVVFLLQACRWWYLLLPVERVHYGQFVRATYVGLYANEVLPLRAGELIRCFLLARSSKIPLSVSFASALIERLFDGVWLMACFFVALKVGRLPHAMVRGGDVLLVIIVVLALTLAYGMYGRKQTMNLLFFDVNLPAWFNTLIEDLHLIGHSRLLYYSFFVSGASMLLQVVPIYAIIKAYHLSLSWEASFTAMVLLRISTALPQAPGNIGLFNWVAARTLALYGIKLSQAKGFSIVLWTAVTLPLIGVGFVIILLAGINMAHLHRQATDAASSTPGANGA